MAGKPVDPAIRDAAEALMRDSDLPVLVIAAQTGARPSTIRTWSRRFNWRPLQRSLVRIPAPAAWPAARRAAVARLYRQPLVEIGDLAVVMGAPRPRAVALFETLALTGRRPGDFLGDGAPGQASPGLRAALRHHIARQIIRLDAALSDPPTTLDTARILRDLGGLKRLLDEADSRDPATGGAHGTGRSDAAHGAELDLPADLPTLRAQIAERYAAWCAERAAPGLPGEPAAGSDPDPVP